MHRRLEFVATSYELFDRASSAVLKFNSEVVRDSIQLERVGDDILVKSSTQDTKMILYGAQFMSRLDWLFLGFGRDEPLSRIGIRIGALNHRFLSHDLEALISGSTARFGRIPLNELPKPMPNKTQHHKSDRAGGSEA